MAIDRNQIENLLYREARFMDTHSYDEWLGLYTDDALYWVPCNHDDVGPEREVSLFYDDRKRMQTRIDRLKGDAAYSQMSKSLLLRLISNIEIEAADNGDTIVYSNFNLSELRRHRQRTIAGRSIHTLRMQDSHYLIARKKVLLFNNDEIIDNLTFLV